MMQGSHDKVQVVISSCAERASNGVISASLSHAILLSLSIVQLMVCCILATMCRPDLEMRHASEHANQHTIIMTQTSADKIAKWQWAVAQLVY